MNRYCFVSLLCLAAPPLFACGLENASQLKSADDLIIYYRVKPSPPLLSQHFLMQFLTCRHGKTATVERFKLDATMPAHRHGMNYQPRVQRLPDGVIEVTGMLFHMPGQWQVVVDYVLDGAPDQIKLDFRI